MCTKFEDDIFGRSSVIMKNVILSFINEYRETTLRSLCDVIDDVITMKIFFLAYFGMIFSLLMSNWSCVLYLDIFKMAAILRLRNCFLPEVIPEFEYATNIAISICDILSFWSML